MDNEARRLEKYPFTSEVQFVNSLRTVITFELEPWGEVYTMEPDAVFKVVAHGRQRGALEVQVGDEKLSIWAWSKCVVELFDGDAELGAEHGHRTPTP